MRFPTPVTSPRERSLSTLLARLLARASHCARKPPLAAMAVCVNSSPEKRIASPAASRNTQGRSQLSRPPERPLALRLQWLPATRPGSGSGCRGLRSRTPLRCSVRSQLSQPHHKARRRKPRVSTRTADVSIAPLRLQCRPSLSFPWPPAGASRAPLCLLLAERPPSEDVPRDAELYEAAVTVCNGFPRAPPHICGEESAGGRAAPLLWLQAGAARPLGSPGCFCLRVGVPPGFADDTLLREDAILCRADSNHGGSKIILI